MLAFVPPSQVIIFIHTYIYIYVCVCLCVCVYTHLIAVCTDVCSDTWSRGAFDHVEVWSSHPWLWQLWFFAMLLACRELSSWLWHVLTALPHVPHKVAQRRCKESLGVGQIQLCSRPSMGKNHPFSIWRFTRYSYTVQWPRQLKCGTIGQRRIGQPACPTCHFSLPTGYKWLHWNLSHYHSRRLWLSCPRWCSSHEHS